MINVDIVGAITRGFEVGFSIISAVALLVAVKLAMIIVQSVIEVFTERAERKGK